MSSAYISEYINLPFSNGQIIMCGQEPGLAIQEVVFAASTQSTPFSAKTKFIRVHVKTSASFEFGVNPVATSAHPRISAGVTEFFGVEPGHKVAFIDNI